MSFDEFYRSVSQAFAQNQRGLPAVERAILVLIALGVAIQLGLVARRWWGRRTRLHEVAARHGVAGPELALVTRLARREGIAPLDLLTRIDLFERATARALAAAPGPGPGPGPDGTNLVAAQVQTLRRALGFDRLPPHTPLLTTRELAPGTGVELGPAHGQISYVDEEALWVRFRGEVLPPSTGQELALALAHAREARYELRGRVVRCRDLHGALEVVLTHDEAPRRVQLRDHARVAVRGAIGLHPVPPWTLHADLRVDVVARLVDVSGGGALVTSRAPLPVGQRLEATFALGEARFQKLPAVVLSAEPQPDGACQARLEWGRLPEAERSRLAAAVSQVELAERERPG